MLPPGMPPGYASEASAAWGSVLGSVQTRERGGRTPTRESTSGTGEAAGSAGGAAGGGANVRSAVQTLAAIGASEFGGDVSGGLGSGGGGGGVDLGGGGGGGSGRGQSGDGDGDGSNYEGHGGRPSTAFGALLAARFGTIESCSAWELELLGLGRASASPTRAALSSPTLSAPPSPPQSPVTDESSPGGKASKRFPLSRQNTQTRPSEASSTLVGGSPGGTPSGPSRLGLGHQRTRGAKLAAATSAAATSVKRATAAAKAAPTRCLGRQETHSVLDKQGSVSPKRFGLGRQRNHSSALSSTSPKAAKPAKAGKLAKAALSPEEEAKARVEPPC